MLPDVPVFHPSALFSPGMEIPFLTNNPSPVGTMCREAGVSTSGDTTMFYTTVFYNRLQ
jgi:hypothetical protein